MHGELPGAASAFLSVASRVEVATFFRYLREDVSQVDDDDLQAVFQLAFRHLPVLAHRALGRAMSAKPEPMGSLVDKLLELRILPPGWKTNDLFGRAAFRERNIMLAEMLKEEVIERVGSPLTPFSTQHSPGIWPVLTSIFSTYFLGLK